MYSSDHSEWYFDLKLFDGEPIKIEIPVPEPPEPEPAPPAPPPVPTVIITGDQITRADLELLENTLCDRFEQIAQNYPVTLPAPIIVEPPPEPEPPHPPLDLPKPVPHEEPKKRNFLLSFLDHIFDG